MQICIAGVKPTSLVNGKGVRYTIFVQGCPHGCPGCHNPATHAFGRGAWMDTATIAAEFLRNKLIDGITLSGGEPLCQTDACHDLALYAHQAGLTVWCYSGYTWEEISRMRYPSSLPLLKEIDVLVDGPYLEEQRDETLKYRGSRNQRLIDVKRSLKKGEVVLWEDTR